ncbi:N-acetylneuraminate lyase-like [Polyodon spathula]|uniref:N-acetylneuraminate lyase-like n=1 Tax=Polyodon spathula TaxID=7913 RepID=UPI001B7EDF35|nr:N-acetylneuraminate lyase-like [Polyodon spathula]
MAVPPPRKALTALVAATFTPMTVKGDVNLSVIGQYVDYLVENQGVHDIFVNGTTGEGMSLSMDERKVLAEEWCRQGKGKVDHVIVHVGCLSLRESQELARHAAGIGADGISAAGISAKAALQGAQELIPSFQGLKFSSRDLLDFDQCVHSSPRSWPMLYGVDEQLLSGLVLGAHGAVGSTYNYMGSVVNGMLAAFEKGGIAEARKIQVMITQFLQHSIGIADVSNRKREVLM